MRDKFNFAPGLISSVNQNPHLARSDSISAAAVTLVSVVRTVDPFSGWVMMTRFSVLPANSSNV